MPSITAHDAKVKAAVYDGIGKHTEYRIAGCPGLILAVHRPREDGTSQKTWLVAYSFRRDGKRISRKKSLGRYPAITLRRAQRVAWEMRDDVDQGIDVVGEAKEARRQEAIAERTFEDLAELYFEARRAETVKTIFEVERAVRLDAFPAIGHLAPKDINRRDIEACLQRLIDAGKLPMARHLRDYLRAIYNYALVIDPDLGEAFGLESNPVNLVGRRTRGSVGKLGAPGVKDRALDDYEIGAFMHALQDPDHGMSQPVRDILWLLLITGQRTIEVREMPISELHLVGRPPTWRLPATRTKNKRPHALPLVPAVIDVLQAQVGRRRKGLVFPSPSNPQNPIEKRVPGRAVDRLFQAGYLTIDRFTPHDLRRTFETGLARLGIVREVRDRVLNHTDTSIGGRAYNRYDFETEKLEALERWTAHVTKLACCAT